MQHLNEISHYIQEVPEHTAHVYIYITRPTASISVSAVHCPLLWPHWDTLNYDVKGHILRALRETAANRHNEECGGRGGGRGGQGRNHLHSLIALNPSLCIP